MLQGLPSITCFTPLLLYSFQIVESIIRIPQVLHSRCRRHQTVVASHLMAGIRVGVGGRAVGTRQEYRCRVPTARFPLNCGFPQPLKWLATAVTPLRGLLLLYILYSFTLLLFYSFTPLLLYLLYSFTSSTPLPPLLLYLLYSSTPFLLYSFTPFLLTVELITNNLLPITKNER